MDGQGEPFTYPLKADIDFLMAFAKANNEMYMSAGPFPHIVIENFMCPESLEAVIRDFLAHETLRWGGMIDKDQNKFAFNTNSNLEPSIRHVLHFLNSKEVVNFLESLTGISGLIPDPHLAGGGLHELCRGGFLKVHADFNWHRQLRLDRRINLLVYLNKNRGPEYAGNMELWGATMTGKVKDFSPLFNRCVIFNTTDKSFHDNPIPVNCPPGRSRCSIAMYYYTNGRPEGEVSATHATLFRNRPGDATAAEMRTAFAKGLVPPLMLDLWRSLKGRQNVAPHS
jgi:Rps23 Pro-64 3,4-dihydroxylase Tpa1-like proline 4-hydroxylase